MSRWRLDTSSEFDRSARQVDRHDLARIRRYLDEVCDLDDPRVRGRRLAGNRSAYWRYRIGDFRVIVDIKDDVLVVIALGLGHPSEIYRR